MWGKILRIGEGLGEEEALSADTEADLSKKHQLIWYSSEAFGLRCNGGLSRLTIKILRICLHCSYIPVIGLGQLTQTLRAQTVGL